MFKKAALLLLTLLLLTVPFVTSAEESSEEIHLLIEERCPHCAEMKSFLEDDFKKDYPEVEINYYRVSRDQEKQAFDRVAEKRSLDYELLTPTAIIGENLFQGFHEEDKELLKKAVEGKDVQEEINEARGVVTVPFFDIQVSTSDVSLPLLAIVLGFIDGLNVCSVGALVLLLMIVLSFDSRKKIILYGGLFILTTVAIYGLLVFAWTALLETLAGFISFLNTFIGIAAFLGGVYFLRETVRIYKYGPTCQSSNNELAKKATNKVKSTFENKPSKTLALVTSVVFFAAVITLVELPCSIGLPMVFGGALAEAGLSWGTYALYIGLYLLIYMLDELVVFAGAVITKEIWFSESSFLKWIYLAGTIVLFLLSYYYLIGF